MDKATTLEAIADELSEFNAFDLSSDTAYLPKMMFKAMREIWSSHPWSFKKATTTITTTSGNLGGYALPADFSGFVKAENNSRVYEKDSVTFARCLDSNGEEVEIYLRRDANQLYFVKDPADATYSLNYVPYLTDINSVSTWPDDLCPIVVELTKSKALMNSKDTIDMAVVLKNSYDQLLSKYWDEERRKQILSHGKTPIGAYGVRIADSVRYGMGR